MGSKKPLIIAPKDFGIKQIAPSPESQVRSRIDLLEARRSLKKAGKPYRPQLTQGAKKG